MNITKHPGIYIHIPFCHSKCGYCDFYSDTNLQLTDKFLKALAVEISLYTGIVEPKTVFDTIYLGGGTPSLLNPEQINTILELLKKNYNFNEHTEITIEVNPGTINKDTLAHYLTMGIKRLSIGVQSFFDDELQFLGRIHNAAEAIDSVEQARETGFKNINIDLIYALPGQILERWENSLNIVNRFSPEHVSTYNLTIEKGTPFHTFLNSGEIIRLPEQQEAAFFMKTHNILMDFDYTHYEVSNFAQTPEYFSRHNYKYWNHTPYLSFGPSAHSFWDNQRWKNLRSTSQYITRLSAEQKPTDQTENLTEDQLIFEIIFLGLRTSAGINTRIFKKKFDKDFRNLYAAQVETLLKSGHATLDDENFALTYKGMLVCDEISAKFII